MSDIVVVGRREKQSDGSYLITYRTEGGVPGIRFLTPREVDENSSFEQDVEVAVAIEQTNTATDRERMEEAARKLIKAVVTVITKLQASSPTAVMLILGRTVTVGEMLQTLQNTHFTVTDSTTFNNRGVGTADRGENGAPNRDTINYEAIEGYAEWLNDSGLHALVLHEVGHMTVAGDAFFERSKVVHSRDSTVSRQFYDTEYATNVEAFANSVMTAISEEIGLNLYGISPGTDDAPRNPEAIYEENNGQPYSD